MTPSSQRAGLLKTSCVASLRTRRGWSLLGRIDAALGLKQEAIAEGRRACELLPISKDAWAGDYYVKDLAVIYTSMGETDMAFEQLAGRSAFRKAAEILCSKRVAVGQIAARDHARSAQIDKQPPLRLNSLVRSSSGKRCAFVVL